MVGFGGGCAAPNLLPRRRPRNSYNKTDVATFRREVWRDCVPPRTPPSHNAYLLGDPQQLPNFIEQSLSGRQMMIPTRSGNEGSGRARCLKLAPGGSVRSSPVRLQRLDRARIIRKQTRDIRLIWANRGRRAPIGLKIHAVGVDLIMLPLHVVEPMIWLPMMRRNRQSIDAVRP